MKNRKIMFITILLLTIGFAAVSTNLIINGNSLFGTNEDDFDVYFSSAVVDGEDYTNEIISEDKQSITYNARELTFMGDTSELIYEVTNASKNYDAEVKVTCTEVGEEVTLTHTPETQVISATDIGDGKVEIKLNKTVVDEKTLTFTCTLNVNAIERTELGSNEVLPSNTYIIEGNYVDESGNAIANANLVIFSETPHYLTTDETGYVFCNGLEKGSHEIYYVEDTLDNIKSMTKGEIISNAVSKTSFTTLSEGELIFDDNSKIAGNRIVTKDAYCNNLVGNVWEYNYIKKEDSLKIICDGIYKLETWGAQGGNVSVYGVSTTGGYGGYSYGNTKLVENQFLYINVGGAGSTSSGGVGVTKQGGYNGGGANTQSEWGYGGTGGGATHIALRSGLLSKLENYKEDVLIVSGGGGSGGVEVTGERYTIGGNAGGYAGVNAKPVNCDGNGCATYGGSGGNQSKGYKFGLGSNGSSWGGAGGGGLYGGTYASGGGGGSSYIANSLLTDKAMYCYGCSKSTNVDTYTVSVSCKNSTPTKNCAKTENGYAKITLVSVE